ncbi:hypothetical protein ICW40_19680 [Actinotalea ferrariae]|uniref:hypothetical protein n=1 Tax=Actinotalea ferrariae TaxID=1386098 RepID=UPI001C8BB355|nr:hypothetical protein [Actinotalea ferrariae]MBX9247015.1 hypothetical protein [Actinotalea ferrariae]
MAGVVLLVLLAFATGLIALVVLLVMTLRSGRPEANPPAVARAARRHEALMSLGAALASLAAVIGIVLLPDIVWTSEFQPLPVAPGVLQYTCPFVGAVVFCLARAVGEQWWPRPSGTVRTAVLARRSVTELGGWRLAALAATTSLGLLAVVGYGVTAAPGGRTVAHVPTYDADGTVIGTGEAGPYPGWPFGIPIAAGLVLAFGAALLALWVVTRRPALALVPREHDDAVRRTSAARVLAGSQAWVGGAMALMMLVAAVPLNGAGHTGGALASLVAGVVVGAGSLVVAVSAIPGLRAREAAGRKAAEPVSA